MMKIKSIEERTPFGVRFSLHNPIALAPLMPDIIAGGAGVVSSLLGGIFGKKSQSDTNETNLQIARETNQMQLQAMREQNAFNERAAIDAFNRENAYNDPANQARMWSNAGFNPQVALGNNAMANTTGNQTAPSSSGLPSFVTPNLVAPPSVMVGAIDSISKLAGAAAQITAAKKTSKETSWIDKEMDATIKEMFSRVRSQEAQASYQEFQTSLDKLFAPFERSSKLRNIWAETKKLGAEYTLACSRNETEKAEKLLKDAERKLTEANERTVNDSRFYIIDNLKRTGEEITSRTNVNKATEGNIQEQTKTQEQQTERQKIMNKYADDIDAAAFANNKAQLIKTLRDAYRTGWNMYDGVRDFANHLRSWFGLSQGPSQISSIDELADWMIDAIKTDAQNSYDDKHKR